jgi:predicted adenylyl cyclase CyaB
MSKIKKSETYHLNGFHIELNSVGKLGYFLEIEKTVKSSAGVRKNLRSPSDGSQNQKTKKELIGLFESLGFARNRFESKGYLKLLEETEKDV